MNGQQGGDPAKLAAALVQLAGRDEPPPRFPGGADAVTTFEDRAKLLLELADANRDLVEQPRPRPVLEPCPRYPPPTGRPFAQARTGEPISSTT